MPQISFGRVGCDFFIFSIFVFIYKSNISYLSAATFITCQIYDINYDVYLLVRSITYQLWRLFTFVANSAKIQIFDLSNFIQNISHVMALAKIA